MDIFDWLPIVSACRRSRVKFRVYDAVIILRVGLVPEIADKARTTPGRVLQVMLGDGKDYRHDSALLTLGVAEARETPAGFAYAVTPRGDEAFAAVRERLNR